MTQATRQLEKNMRRRRSPCPPLLFRPRRSSSLNHRSFPDCPLKLILNISATIVRKDHHCNTLPERNNPHMRLLQPLKTKPSLYLIYFKHTHKMIPLFHPSPSSQIRKPTITAQNIQTFITVIFRATEARHAFHAPFPFSYFFSY